MFTEDIVLLLKKIRKEKKVAQEALSKGICSPQQISKLEQGKVVPDFFLLEILLQRLGKTPDKLEVVLSGDEFDEIMARDDIIDHLRCGRIEEAEKGLELFRHAMESGFEGEPASIVRRMNGYRIQGIFALETENYPEAEKNLCLAAEMSMGKISEINFERDLLSEIELESLILLAQVWQKLGKTENAETLLKQVNGYIRKKISDEEQLVKFLPKIAVVYADICESAGEPEANVPLCKEAAELLRKHGMLQNMTLLLTYLAEDCERKKQEKNAKKYLVWKDAIEQVYNNFGLDVSMVNKLYFNSCVGQYYLTGELIREERLSQGFSQESLIEEIYNNPESLSRLESGRKPDRKKQQLLMEKLGLQRKCYNGRVITNDYDLLELYSEVSIAIARKEYMEAMWGLKQLRRRLDMSIAENRQIVECFETVYKYRKEGMTKEKALQEVENLLKLTYPEGSERVPFEGEALLLNQMGALLGQTERCDDAIALYQKVIARYENSHVPLKYHFRSAYLLAENMSRYMAHMGYGAEAVRWSEMTLTADLSNGKGNTVHVALGNLTGQLMKEEDNRTLCETYVKWAYYFTDIFRQYHDQKYLNKYEKEHFDKNVEWY